MDATRAPYSKKEDKMMCQFLLTELRNEHNPDAKFPAGNLIWRKAKSKKLFPDHSYQSLRDHMRRVVLPNLSKYGLPKADYKYLKKAFHLAKNRTAAETEDDDCEQSETIDIFTSESDADDDETDSDTAGNFFKRIFLRDQAKENNENKNIAESVIGDDDVSNKFTDIKRAHKTVGVTRSSKTSIGKKYSEPMKSVAGCSGLSAKKKRNNPSKSATGCADVSVNSEPNKSTKSVNDCGEVSANKHTSQPVTSATGCADLSAELNSSEPTKSATGFGDASANNEPNKPAKFVIGCSDVLANIESCDGLSAKKKCRNPSISATHCADVSVNSEPNKSTKCVNDCGEESANKHTSQPMKSAIGFDGLSAKLDSSKPTKSATSVSIAIGFGDASANNKPCKHAKSVIGCADVSANIEPVISAAEFAHSSIVVNGKTSSKLTNSENKNLEPVDAAESIRESVRSKNSKRAEEKSSPDSLSGSADSDCDSQDSAPVVDRVKRMRTKFSMSENTCSTSKETFFPTFFRGLDFPVSNEEISTENPNFSRLSITESQEDRICLNAVNTAEISVLENNDPIEINTVNNRNEDSISYGETQPFTANYECSVMGDCFEKKSTYSEEGNVENSEINESLEKNNPSVDWSENIDDIVDRVCLEREINPFVKRKIKGFMKEHCCVLKKFPNRTKLPERLILLYEMSLRYKIGMKKLLELYSNGEYEDVSHFEKWFSANKAYWV